VAGNRGNTTYENPSSSGRFALPSSWRINHSSSHREQLILYAYSVVYHEMQNDIYGSEEVAVVKK